MFGSHSRALFAAAIFMQIFRSQGPDLQRVRHATLAFSLRRRREEGALIGFWAEYGVVVPTVLPAVGRRGPRPGFYLRKTLTPEA